MMLRGQIVMEGLPAAEPMVHEGCTFTGTVDRARSYLSRQINKNLVPFLAQTGNNAPATVTISGGKHWYDVGDRIKFVSDSNRVRRFVSRVVSSMSFEIKTYYRPSRGYARHVRRVKQAQRSAL